VEIVENRALRLRVKNPARITNVIPKSAVVGDNEVVVRWGLEEAQVLRNLGIKNVPSPIEKDYDWPGMYTPFAHQKKTAAFLTMHRRALCLNDMGSGKTSSVIWAADYLLDIKAIRRVLIVCPLSVMAPAWQQDLFKCAMHRTVEIAHARDRRQRRKLIQSDAEFVIINYDGLGIVADDIMADQRFDLLVADEANYLKNPATRRWKTFAKLVRPDSWIWLLTGTPASQSPLDAYGLARLVNPEGVPRYFTGFRDLVMNKVTQFRWVPKSNAIDIVHKALQPAIRFTKEQCLDLPDMMFTTRDVPMSKQQEKYYKEMRNEMLVLAAGEEVSAVNAAAKLTKLLQISAGSVYADSREIVDFDCGGRMSVLKEIIDESTHKILVFAPYRHSIYAIAQELKKTYTVDVIDGGVGATKRADIIKRFQSEPDPRILVIQPQAAAHGITLHAANTVVWWSPITSFETYTQANNRVHRAGQTNKVTIVHLQGSSVERKLYKMLEGKKDIHEKLVDLYREEIDDERNRRAGEEGPD
jgi:SNF2 family DNA or RNA helicase